jgi:putative hemolysin
MDTIDAPLIRQPREPAARSGRNGLTVSLARTASEVREAQALRYRVFVEEMGARLSTRHPGLDHDHFDAACEHLLVRDSETLQVVGTYRLLSAESARRIGAFYADGEFDLVRLQHLRHRTVEVGRACIHPDYRTGGAIMLLWAGLARYMLERRYDYLIGCASIAMKDGGANAAAVYRALGDRHLAPVEYRVFPRHPLPLEHLQTPAEAHVPALLRGYLKLGSWICGEPAWDPDFNTADLFVLLPLSRVEMRYARHFLGCTELFSTHKPPLGA